MSKYLSLSKGQDGTAREAWLNSPDAKMSAYAREACVAQDYGLSLSEYVSHVATELHKDALPPYKDVQDSGGLGSGSNTVGTASAHSVAHLESHLNSMAKGTLLSKHAEKMKYNMLSIRAYLGSTPLTKLIFGGEKSMKEQAADAKIEAAKTAAKDAQEFTKELATSLIQTKNSTHGVPSEADLLNLGTQMHAAYSAMLMERQIWHAQFSAAMSQEEQKFKEAGEAHNKLLEYGSVLKQYARYPIVQAQAESLRKDVDASAFQVLESKKTIEKGLTAARKEAATSMNQFRAVQSLVAKANQPSENLSDAERKAREKQAALDAVIKKMKAAAKRL
jgi:hypothetical protein